MQEEKRPADRLAQPGAGRLGSFRFVGRGTGPGRSRVCQTASPRGRSRRPGAFVRGRPVAVDRTARRLGVRLRGRARARRFGGTGAKEAAPVDTALAAPGGCPHHTVSESRCRASAVDRSRLAWPAAGFAARRRHRRGKIEAGRRGSTHSSSRSVPRQPGGEPLAAVGQHRTAAGSRCRSRLPAERARQPCDGGLGCVPADLDDRGRLASIAPRLSVPAQLGSGDAPARRRPSRGPRGTENPGAGVGRPSGGAQPPHGADGQPLRDRERASRPRTDGALALHADPLSRSHESVAGPGRHGLPR